MAKHIVVVESCKRSQQEISQIETRTEQQVAAAELMEYGDKGKWQQLSSKGRRI